MEYQIWWRASSLHMETYHLNMASLDCEKGHFMLSCIIVYNQSSPSNKPLTINHQLTQTQNSKTILIFHYTNSALHFPNWSVKLCLLVTPPMDTCFRGASLLSATATPWVGAEVAVAKATLLGSGGAEMLGDLRTTGGSDWTGGGPPAWVTGTTTGRVVADDTAWQEQNSNWNKGMNNKNRECWMIRTQDTAS